MNTQEIIQAFENLEGNFPGSELVAAREQKEEVTPALISIIEKTVENLESILKEENYLGYVFALFLLAEFRESKAMPAVLNLISQPEEAAWEMMGDILTEDLGRILASISNGETDSIKQIIENDSLDDFVRTAALDAMLILTARGELSRKKLVAYFESLYQSGLEKQSSLVWNHLVVCSINIYPVELQTCIKEAYEKELVDEEFISIQFVEEALQSGKEVVLDWLENNPDYTYVTDAVADLTRWLA